MTYECIIKKSKTLCKPTNLSQWLFPHLDEPFSAWQWQPHTQACSDVGRAPLLTGPPWTHLAAPWDRTATWCGENREQTLWIKTSEVAGGGTLWHDCLSLIGLVWDEHSMNFSEKLTPALSLSKYSLGGRVALMHEFICSTQVFFFFFFL